MKVIRKLLLLARTVRHLRFRQVAFQFWYRVRPKPKILASSLADVRGCQRDWNGCLFNTQSYFPESTFEFLNMKVTIASAAGWNSTNYAKLWLYNLHYFDDLNAVDSADRVAAHKALILRWIHENPVMHGNGWEPYPLSLRIVNWIKWLKRFPEQTDDVLLGSLHTQVKALEKQLEFHILANHLFANIKALVFAGCHFEGVDAQRWLGKGLGLLKKELAEQFLPDGAHYERSPMYHCILLWDVLDLICLLRCYGRGNTETLERVAKRGLGWLDSIKHNDGEVPFFNDSTFGIAPSVENINEYASRLEIFSNHQALSESGFVSLNSDDFKLIADIGEIGPSYQPGHAHAETGSFELSAFSHRVFVNSGINEYGISPERLSQRSTAAHNAVSAIVGGRELSSSEVWSGFRVARRAKVKAHRGISQASCETQGFYHGFRTVTHKRVFSLSDDGKALNIADELVRADGGRAYFYLHPDCHAKLQGARLFIDVLDKSLAVQFNGSDINVVMEPSEWFCGFGKSVANLRVVVEFRDKLETFISI